MSGSRSERPKILITNMDIPQSAFDIFKNKYELIICDAQEPRQTLLRNIKGVDAVLLYGHDIQVNKELIDAAGDRLVVIGSMGAGYNHIDVELLRKRNIKVSNTPNILSNAVADMAVGLALAVSRNILHGYNAILKNQWVSNSPTWMCGPALEGATVGIVGLGAIGSQIAKRMKSFSIGKLLYSNRSERPEAKDLEATLVSVNDLLSESDFVFLTVPLTSETKHLINMERLKLMKKTGIIINVSRGEVINQDDLVKALQTRIIGGAGLDVMTPEPLPPGHVLTTLPNVVLTPHISSATFQARENMAKLAALNIHKALSGEQLLTPI